MTDGLEARIELARRLLLQSNPAEIWNQASDHGKYNIALLYGYVRSFVRLALLRDIYLVAEELEVKRQTVGRHIHELENLLQCQLFHNIGRRSLLTDSGMLWLPRAEEMFDLASGFDAVQGQTNYRSVLIPLRTLLAEDAESVTKSFVNTWMRSTKSSTSQSLKKFRQNWVIYERHKGSWRSREIGDKSGFAQWFGAGIAKEATGQTITDMASGADLKDELSLLLDGVYTRGGVQVSEASCMLPRSRSGIREPLMYQRVLAEMLDDDGRPVVASVIKILDPPPPSQVADELAKAF